MSRLPRRVYWFRRVSLLAILGVSVFGVSRALPGSDAASTASPGPAAADRTPSRPASSAADVRQLPAGGEPDRPRPTGNSRPDTTRRGSGGTEQPRARKDRRENRPALPEPDGPCRPRQVTLTPTVADRYRVGDSPVLRLAIRTTGRPACTLEPSPDTLVVEVTGDSGVVWSTDTCPAAITPSSLTVRAARPTTYRVQWSGLRAKPRCSDTAARAPAGTYWVKAAIIGGEPAQAQFSLAQARRTPTR